MSSRNLSSIGRGGGGILRLTSEYSNKLNTQADTARGSPLETRAFVRTSKTRSLHLRKRDTVGITLSFSPSRVNASSDRASKKHRTKNEGRENDGRNRGRIRITASAALRTQQAAKSAPATFLQARKKASVRDSRVYSKSYCGWKDVTGRFVPCCLRSVPGSSLRWNDKCFPDFAPTKSFVCQGNASPRSLRNAETH